MLRGHLLQHVKHQHGFVCDRCQHMQTLTACSYTSGMPHCLHRLLVHLYAHSSRRRSTSPSPLKEATGVQQQQQPHPQWAMATAAILVLCHNLTVHCQPTAVILCATNRWVGNSWEGCLSLSVSLPALFHSTSTLIQSAALPHACGALAPYSWSLQQCTLYKGGSVHIHAGSCHNNLCMQPDWWAAGKSHPSSTGACMLKG